MRNNIKAILAKQGQAPVIHSIDKSIRDFRSMDYTRAEIKETIRDIFFGLDSIVDAHIIKLGY